MNRQFNGFGQGNVLINNGHVDAAWSGEKQGFPFVPIYSSFVTPLAWQPQLPDSVIIQDSGAHYGGWGFLVYDPGPPPAVPTFFTPCYPDVVYEPDRAFLALETFFVYAPPVTPYDPANMDWDFKQAENIAENNIINDGFSAFYPGSPPVSMGWVYNEPFVIFDTQAQTEFSTFFVPVIAPAYDPSTMAWAFTDYPVIYQENINTVSEFFVYSPPVTPYDPASMSWLPSLPDTANAPDLFNYATEYLFYANFTPEPSPVTEVPSKGLAWKHKDEKHSPEDERRYRKYLKDLEEFRSLKLLKETAPVAEVKKAVESKPKAQIKRFIDLDKKLKTLAQIENEIILIERLLEQKALLEFSILDDEEAVWLMMQ